jgi:hypothetical protein
MSIIEAKVGPQLVGDGGQNTLRSERTGGLTVTQLHGAYTETSRYGTVMVGSNAVAGVAPGTALSTAPPFALWNPPSSGRKLSLLKLMMGYVSGTLGAGSVLLAAVLSQQTVPTTGTELVPVCTDLGMPRGVGRIFTGSTWVSTPQILYPVISMGAFLATTAVPPWDVIDVVDGSIIVEPGTGVMLQAIAAAGTTPLVVFGMKWEELPI